MDKLKNVIEEKLNFSDMENEDGGCFKCFKCFRVAKDFETEDGMYVKICSWDESRKHLEFEKFINRKVRITIETID